MMQCDEVMVIINTRFGAKSRFFDRVGQINSTLLLHVYSIFMKVGLFTIKFTCVLV